MNTEITKQVDEIAEAIYLMQLSPPVARKRRADIYQILLRSYTEMKKEINDLSRRLYIAEKAVEDSKL